MTASSTMASTDSQAERSKLRRELRRFDTIFFLMSAMVVVDTLGAIAIGGGQAFTWLIVLFLTFFIPSALASAELGAALPEEGGAYVWVRSAFGRFAGSITSMFYWAGTPIWLGGSVTAVAMSVYRRFLGPLPTGGMYVFGALFIGAATVAAVVPLRFGKWVPTSGAIGQIVLLSLFTVTVVLYGLRHGIHGIAVERPQSVDIGADRRRAGADLLLRRRRAAVHGCRGDARSASATSPSPSPAPASASC